MKLKFSDVKRMNQNESSSTEKAKQDSSSKVKDNEASKPLDEKTRSNIQKLMLLLGDGDIDSFLKEQSDLTQLSAKKTSRGELKANGHKHEKSDALKANKDANKNAHENKAKKAKTEAAKKHSISSSEDSESEDVTARRPKRKRRVSEENADNSIVDIRTGVSSKFPNIGREYRTYYDLRQKRRVFEWCDGKENVTIYDKVEELQKNYDHMQLKLSDTLRNVTEVNEEIRKSIIILANYVEKYNMQNIKKYEEQTHLLQESNENVKLVLETLFKLVNKKT